MENSYKRFLSDNLLEKIKYTHDDQDNISFDEIANISSKLHECNINRNYTLSANTNEISHANHFIMHDKNLATYIPEKFKNIFIVGAKLHWTGKGYMKSGILFENGLFMAIYTKGHGTLHLTLEGPHDPELDFLFNIMRPTLTSMVKKFLQNMTH